VGLELGIFVVPDATNAAGTVAQIIEAERSGPDMVGVQDHPYQRRFFDTWTLLVYVAGSTERDPAQLLVRGAVGSLRGPAPPGRRSAPRAAPGPPTKQHAQPAVIPPRSNAR
jgi:alkanesulfonate monooxygenase SsuD/methylene tetrahydromethanopterin reductase-like flavin-dependent oxidoreductase (luciferase family)